MPDRLLTFADKWRFGIIAACFALFFLFAPFTALCVDWWTMAPVYVTAAVVAALGFGYRLLGRDEGIAAATLVVAQIIIYSNIVAVDNYLGLELRRPLNDEFLAGLDRALGLDWWGYVNWVKATPLVGKVLSVAYLSSLAQVAVVICALGFTRRFERLDRYSLAFMFSAAMTIAVWSAFPSFGALPLHYAQGLPEPPFALVMSKEEALKLLALHAGSTPLLQFKDFLGLIGCPSFHTALAILSVYGLWGTPYLGPLALVVNILVLMSVPADGGHHFVDVGAGAAVTVLSIYLAERALTSQRRRDVQPAPEAPCPARLPA
jgi:hypothetical protein